MLRNNLSSTSPEPVKIIINRHNVEFRAPDGSLQLRLPAADIEDFTLVHYSQSGGQYYIIVCLQFRDGSIFPLQQFLREDMAAAQLAPLREKLRAMGKDKREGRAEYPALQQVASLEKSQLQASVRYALSSYSSLLLLLLTLLGFCLAFVRILHEVLGAAGAVWRFFEIPKP